MEAEQGRADSRTSEQELRLALQQVRIRLYVCGECSVLDQELTSTPFASEMPRRMERGSAVALSYLMGMNLVRLGRSLPACARRMHYRQRRGWSSSPLVGGLRAKEAVL